MPGILYIVSTPIGNLSDIPPRITQALADSDFLLVEDTRVTIKLISHLGLKKRLISCHEHNEQAREELLQKAASENKTVSLVSDAGTPLISDPGYKIVAKAIACGMQVVPLPGPSAFLLALVGSGLPCDRFVFEGFLPDRTGAALQRLIDLQAETRTLIFYVSPHKVKKTLNLVADCFGSRPACLARELTKLHEQFMRADLLQLRDDLEHWEPRGECVLVIGGNTAPAPRPSQAEITDAINAQIQQGKHVKELSVEIAQRFGLKRSEVYRQALGLAQQALQKPS